MQSQTKPAGEENMIELYHFWSSVCSVRCRMALEEKGVKWTSRYIDLFKFDQMKPEYLAINPDGLVPTLVHDGQPIRESTIINEYIDAAFPGPKLIPADPLKTARMREFIHRCEASFDGIVKLTFVKYILPKLRNRWSHEELLEQAERRPMKYYRDIHGRGVRGEITEAELAAARPCSRNCSTSSNARSILARGSSARTTRSPRSPSRPTCSASRRSAPISSGRTTGGRA
jgi:glutathione S-transferase/GST-like protein